MKVSNEGDAKEREIAVQAYMASIIYAATIIADAIHPENDRKAYLHDLDNHMEMAADLYNKVSWKNGR